MSTLTAGRHGKSFSSEFFFSMGPGTKFFFRVRPDFSRITFSELQIFFYFFFDFFNFSNEIRMKNCSKIFSGDFLQAPSICYEIDLLNPRGSHPCLVLG